MKTRTLGMLILTGLVVATIIGYQLLSNTLREDSQAEKDLTTLSSKVNSYFTNNSKLPEKLEDLKVGTRLQSRLDRYDFNKKGRSKYELCATFKRPGQSTDTDYGVEDEDSKNSLKGARLTSVSSKTISSQVNSHATGKQCFEEDADRYGYLDDYRSNSTSLNSSSTTDAPDGTQIGIEE